MTVSDWASEYMQLIEDCEIREQRLDDWSRAFIDSLKRQITEGRRPTHKQVDKLDEVWEQATSRG